MADAIAEGGDVFFREAGGVDGVVKNDGDSGGPKHPVAGAMMFERADQADGNDGEAQLLSDAEAAILEFVDMAVTSALGFGKNDQAGAGVDGVLREAPHALEVGRAADVGDWNIAETFHQPTIGGNFEMRLELPTADELRNGAIEDEWVEEIDVVDHEEAGALRIEAGGATNFNSGTGEKGDAAAEIALQPVVFARIQEDP